MSNKIIFLDIDGVLNCWGSMIFIGQSTIYTPNFNPMSLMYLKSIVELSGAKVVVHSSWVNTFGMDEVVEMFAGLGFDKEIFLDVNGVSYNRRERVQQLIDQYKPDEYVILDDVNMTDTFGDNMVHCNKFNGLSYENMLRAKYLLGVEFNKVVMM